MYIDLGQSGCGGDVTIGKDTSLFTGFGPGLFIERGNAQFMHASTSCGGI